MKKKIGIILLLIALICVLVLVVKRISWNQEEQIAIFQKEDLITESKDFEKEKCEEITVSYLYYSSLPENLEEVEKEINTITEEKIKVTVHLYPIQIDDAMNGGYYLLLGQGEEIDLLNIAYEGIQKYMNYNMISGMEDLLDTYGPDIKELMKSYPISDGMIFGDEIYGLHRVNDLYGYQNCIVMHKEIFEKTNTELKDIYTIEEIEEIFGAICKMDENITPLAILKSDFENVNTYAANFIPFCPINGSVSYGVLMDQESTEIVNFFETDAYYQYLKRIKNWYDKGFIDRDGLMNDTPKDSLLKAKICAADARQAYVDSKNINELIFGGDIVQLNISEGYYVSRNSNASTYWTIANQSKHKEAVMKFLNLLYIDAQLNKIWSYGFQDEIQYSPATNNLLLESELEDVNWNELNQWSKNNMKNTYKCFGYSFDDTKISVELIRVNRVLKKYLPILETGVSKDWETVYWEMISELKKAGIDTIIRNNQMQFDEWRNQ